VRPEIAGPVRDEQLHLDDWIEPYPTVVDQDVVMLQGTGEGEIKNVNKGDGRRVAVKRDGLYADLMTIGGEKIVLENDEGSLKI
jgi:hypothetical protein